MASRKIHESGPEGGKMFPVNSPPSPPSPVKANTHLLLSSSTIARVILLSLQHVANLFFVHSLKHRKGNSQRPQSNEYERTVTCKGHPCVDFIYATNQSRSTPITKTQLPNMFLGSSNYSQKRNRRSHAPANEHRRNRTRHKSRILRLTPQIVQRGTRWRDKQNETLHYSEKSFVIGCLKLLGRRRVSNSLVNIPSSLCS